MVIFPNSVSGLPSTGQVAGKNFSGLLAVVIDPNGHKCGIYSQAGYSISQYGQITPAVACHICGWSDFVTIDSSPVDE